MLEGDAAFAAEDVQQRSVVESDRLTERMAHAFRGRYRFLGVSDRLVLVSAVPREMAEVRAAKDADVRPREQCQHRFRWANLGFDSLGYMVQRCLQLTQ